MEIRRQCRAACFLPQSQRQFWDTAWVAKLAVSVSEGLYPQSCCASLDLPIVDNFYEHSESLDVWAFMP